MAAPVYRERGAPQAGEGAARPVHDDSRGRRRAPRGTVEVDVSGVEVDVEVSDV